MSLRLFYGDFVEFIEVPDSPEVTLGRGSSASLRLPRGICDDYGTISRSHCTIEKLADGYVVLDNGSSNGTFLNGKRLTYNPHRSSELSFLEDGDILQLGGVRLLVQIVEGKPTETLKETERLPKDATN